jgi:UDP-N-acetylmuramate--alanine ligase
VADPVLDLTRPARFHLVAVGGKAMSAMAELLVAMGHTVTGSDLSEVAELDRLRDLGVQVTVGHQPDNVGAVDYVACSTAVPADNVERLAALERGIPVLGRPALQGAIVRTRRPIAVSGTHGKTTTTAMLVTILTHAGVDPSYIVGAKMGGDLGSARWGEGEWFVVEADESDGTFLEVGAEVALVTNVDADHLDHWGSLDALEAAFDRFLAEATGPTVVCADDPIASRLGHRHGSISVGTSSGVDWSIVDVSVGRGSTRFELVHEGHVISVQLPAPGLHNARNAAAAIAAAHAVGVDPHRSAAALAGYPGLERRFEVRGEAAGVTVVDDYAHNPAKVAAVLSAAAAGGWDRVVAVFQPHRYSRTEDLWQVFASSFVDADTVWVTELDPAGEAPRPAVSGHLVVEAIVAAHPDADVRWAPDRGRLVDDLVASLRPGDVCLTIGAGDITELGAPLLAALAEPADG